MWFKKKSVLQNEGHYNTEFSADGSTDLRTTWKQYKNTNSSSINSGVPSSADAGNYFYLPALGYYDFGQLSNIGIYGYYWSSSAYPLGNLMAYHLRFDSGSVYVYSSRRYGGFRVGGFE